jgi:5'-nucleotidase
MRLLISNDDGIFARGIQTLANRLVADGHQITVVCPDRERSATGHGLTVHRPIRAEQMSGIFDPAIEAWACSGTPSDCVKLALGAILKQPPELVLSGINHGPNLGTDVLYSGTVSAAMEGVIEGLPSVAFSLASFQSQNFEPAAEFASQLVQRIKQEPLPEGVLLSVNVPVVDAEAIRGVRVTRQGVRRYVDQFDRRIDPRGRPYFWLAGEVLEDVPLPDNGHLSDVAAIRDNYITITPLQYDLTHHRLLRSLDHLADLGN